MLEQLQLPPIRVRQTNLCGDKHEALNVTDFSGPSRISHFSRRSTSIL